MPIIQAITSQIRGNSALTAICPVLLLSATAVAVYGVTQQVTTDLLNGADNYRRFAAADTILPVSPALLCNAIANILAAFSSSFLVVRFMDENRIIPARIAAPLEVVGFAIGGVVGVAHAMIRNATNQLAEVPDAL